MEDRDEFERRYVARLEHHGVDKICRRLAELAAAHGAVGLVLLCFENVQTGPWCHRRMFASRLDADGHLVPLYPWGALKPTGVR